MDEIFEKDSSIAEIKRRILEFIRFLNVSKKEFCQYTGVSYANLSGTSLKSEIGGSSLSKILNTYPQLSPRWLIQGKGEMTKSEQEEEAKAYKIEGNSCIGIPLIPVDAMAGYLQGEEQDMLKDCDYYIAPALRNADFLITVRGSSMQPRYNSGDIVACKRLFLDNIFFQWNKVYVLDTCQGVLIKRIKASKDKDHLVLVSENPTYDPFELPKAEIRAIAMVIGVIRLE